MTRPKLLDLYCCEGGAAQGYHRAGFDVVGVDIRHQPRYPFEFHEDDALKVLDDWLANGASGYIGLVREFAAVHASPPCQDHSETNRLSGDHGTGWLLTATRNRLTRLPLPWIIENVDGSALPRQPDLFGANGLELCGCMFPELRGLLYENRLFETSFPVPQPPHRLHIWRQTKMGRPPQPGECMQLTGHFNGAAEGRRRLGADWMTRDGLAQAIPPAYTEHIGRELMARLQEAAA